MGESAWRQFTYSVSVLDTPRVKGDEHQVKLSSNKLAVSVWISGERLKPIVSVGVISREWGWSGRGGGRASALSSSS